MKRVSADEALDALMGTTCFGCGGSKAAERSFCGGCYFKLPEFLRRALYRRIGHGYEQAYTDSLAYLGDRAERS